MRAAMSAASSASGSGAESATVATPVAAVIAPVAAVATTSEPPMHSQHQKAAASKHHCACTQTRPTKSHTRPCANPLQLLSGRAGWKR